MGAPHRLNRVFILAWRRLPDHLADPGCGQLPRPGRDEAERTGAEQAGGAVANSPDADGGPGICGTKETAWKERRRRSSGGGGGVGESCVSRGSTGNEDSSCGMGHAAGKRLEDRGFPPVILADAFPPGPEDIERWRELLVRFPWLRPALSPAEAESALRNLPDGMARLVGVGRTDALRACGNGVVALQAAAAAVELLLRAAGNGFPIRAISGSTDGPG